MESLGFLEKDSRTRDRWVFFLKRRNLKILKEMTMGTLFATFLPQFFRKDAYVRSKIEKITLWHRKNWTIHPGKTVNFSMKFFGKLMSDHFFSVSKPSRFPEIILGLFEISEFSQFFQITLQKKKIQTKLKKLFWRKSAKKKTLQNFFSGILLSKIFHVFHHSSSSNEEKTSYKSRKNTRKTKKGNCTFQKSFFGLSRFIWIWMRGI